MMKTVSGPQFGSHIIIKLPEQESERNHVVDSFRELAKQQNVAHAGTTVLAATVEDTAQDQVFIQFAKNRQLRYVDIPLTVHVLDAIKQARKLFGLDS